MRVSFWGVRGSIPTPGADTSRYGGNTACITIELNPDTTLILDAGSGLCSFGTSVPARDHTYYILLSHLHWDHIQGFPMFKPLSSAGTAVQFISPEGAVWGECTGAQFGGVHFPIELGVCPASVQMDETADSFRPTMAKYFDDVSVFNCNHPGGAFGYRFQSGDRSLVYLTDNELPVKENLLPESEVVSFCKNATYLIHDAQYLEGELEGKRGWGHSDVESVCKLAHLADVGELMLFHHDPERTDVELDRIKLHAETLLRGHDSVCLCTVAAEGDSVDL